MLLCDSSSSASLAVLLLAGVLRVSIAAVREDTGVGVESLTMYRYDHDQTIPTEMRETQGPEYKQQ